ncbi:MAG: zf-TFIIB domain-containing protein [Labilithrix sp.]|nr:zf-TFIIB domain-containing protein [Labilithrix sp.]MCW5817462.1 zf-TFIIB domain-containing protein [Labilithrix sp.]
MSGTKARSARRHSLRCPRDKRAMGETTMGEAAIDVCGACEGAFFDSGKLFAAAGIAADPSSWDHPETGGAVKESASPIRCPRCEDVVMQAQDVAFDGHDVEIDRCGGSGGVWLDKGELDAIVAIGHAMRPVLDAAPLNTGAAQGLRRSSMNVPSVPFVTASQRSPSSSVKT